LPSYPPHHRSLPTCVPEVIPVADIVIFILAFVALDLLALRFGACSRPTYRHRDDRPNW